MSALKKDYGCIMGRWQSPYLHEGHMSIIEQVYANHENLIICVGVHAGQNSSKNPLDYRTRQVMLQSKFPDAIVLPIPDKPSDKVWSDTLDQRIGEVLPPMVNCTLYGGRDSFIPYYSGRHTTKELESPDLIISATSLRDRAIEKALDSVEFRAGVMYALSRRFPSPYGTVDFAVTRGESLLVVQKEGEAGWRLGGGFGDNEGANGWEDDAFREAREELGDDMVFSKNITYIKSFLVDDWRYRGTREKIKTILYHLESPSGDVDPRDDIKFAKWVPFSELHTLEVEIVHHSLMVAFIDYATGLS